MQLINMLLFVVLLLVCLYSKVIGASELEIYEQLFSTSTKRAINIPQEFAIISNRVKDIENLFKSGHMNPTIFISLDSTPNYLLNLTVTLEHLIQKCAGILTVVINTEDPFSILREFGKLDYKHPVQFFVISGKNTEQDLSRMNSLPLKFLNINSDVYILSTATPSRSDTEMHNLQIEEIYSFKNTAFHQLVKIDVDKTVLLEILQKAPRRRNLKKLPVVGALSITFGRDNAYRAEVNETTGEVKLISGFRIEEFFNMRDSLNFTGIGIIGDGFANLGPDGKLVGIGKLISESVADVSIPSSEMIPYRLKELTFLHPSSSLDLVAYFKQLPARSQRDIYWQAFQTDVWNAYFSIWAGFTLIVLGFSYIWKQFKSRKGTQSHRAGIFLYGFCTIGLICQRGYFRISTKAPKALKIVLLSGLLSSFILYTAYCGSLVSMLSKPTLPVKSFRDIIFHQFDIHGDEETNSAKSYIQYLYRNFAWQPPASKLNGEVSRINSSTALTKILQSKSAFITNPRIFHGFLSGRNITDQYMCEEVSRVPIDGLAVKTGMFVKKGSPLKEILNHHILQMFERGIRHRIESRFKKYTSLNCLKTGPTGGKIQLSINIKDIFSALKILAAGFVISLLVLCLESVANRFGP